MNEKEFIKFLDENNINNNEKELDQLTEYKNLLKEYNQKYNLTAIIEDKEIYLKHFCDSLLLLKYFDFNNNINLVDIGTGAGFPGMVLKIFKPNLKLYLIESNGKKCSFLHVVKEKLNMTEVEIVNCRAEDYAVNNIDKFDVVVSRAVANLKVLVELSLPLVKKNGVFIAMKGKLEEELTDSNRIISKLNGKILDIKKYKLPVLEHDRSIVIIQKTDKNPKGYPRKYNEIVKSNWKRKQNKLSL